MAVEGVSEASAGDWKSVYLFVIFRLHEITGTVEDFPPGDFSQKLVVAIVVAVGGVELLFKKSFCTASSRYQLFLSRTLNQS